MTVAAIEGTQTFLLPDLGEGLTEGTVVRWMVAEGDEIAIDQAMVEIETAKSIVEVPSPFAGVVATLHATEGETLPVGEPLVTVATVGVAYDNSTKTYDSTVKLWDVRTGKLKQVLVEEKDSHQEIAFSRDLLAIAVNGDKRLREVRLLDAKTLKLKHQFDETHVPGIFTWGRLAFSPDGKRLAVAGSTTSDDST